MRLFDKTSEPFGSPGVLWASVVSRRGASLLCREVLLDDIMSSERSIVGDGRVGLYRLRPSSHIFFVFLSNRAAAQGVMSWQFSRAVHAISVLATLASRTFPASSVIICAHGIRACGRIRPAIRWPEPVRLAQSACPRRALNGCPGSPRRDLSTCVQVACGPAGTSGPLARPSPLVPENK